MFAQSRRAAWKSLEVFGINNLGFDDGKVMWTGQAIVRLPSLWLDGCEYQCWRILGIFIAL